LDVVRTTVVNLVQEPASSGTFLVRRSRWALPLITQMGEQADYLRFMPERPGAALRWWAGVLAGGPGWVVMGVLKMLGGAMLAYLAISHMVPPERAVDPNQMYLAAYEYMFPALRLGGGGHGHCSWWCRRSRST
jgi:hypothetical protein